MNIQDFLNAVLKQDAERLRTYFSDRHISTGIVPMSISRLKNTYKQIASIREHGTE